MTTHLNQPDVTVWGGISCNGPKYLDIFTDGVVPQLRPWHLVDTWMRHTLSIGLGDWGALSGHHISRTLTPMDFCFWGVVKDKVYFRKPLVEEFHHNVHVCTMLLNI